MAGILKPALLAGAAVAVGLRVISTRPRLRRTLLDAGDVVARRTQRMLGGWQGARYRLTGGAPDPDVDDRTLADRVRSTIGPLEKRLDLPHVHVLVEDHVVLLHGEVGSQDEAAQLERAVRNVSGVRGVESYLHVGLLKSDTRPSAGRAEPSTQRRRLVAAAERAGIDAAHAEEVARTVLGAFIDAVPAGERRHVSAHLSPDVQALIVPPHRHGAEARPRTVADLVRAITAEAKGLDEARARAAAGEVLAELRALVPEERADVGAVLPADLRELWERPTGTEG